MAAGRLFSGLQHAESYAKYRPLYPANVYETILSSCEGRNLAIDVACGTGQNTLPLAQHFTKVIGIDISQAQVSQAISAAPHNVTYKVGPGEDLSFVGDTTVDLVTCAQGVHWMDRPVFYKEVDRVLKPGGVLALLGYIKPALNNKKADEVLNELYHVTLGPHWAPGIYLLDNQYKYLEFPYNNETRLDGFLIETKLSLTEVMGYFTSWSAYRTFIEKQPESTALADVEKRIREAYKEEEIDADVEEAITLSFNVFILMANKPK